MQPLEPAQEIGAERPSTPVAEDPLAGALQRAVQQRATASAGRRAGLPDDVRASVEALSGVSLADVDVHYDSPRPAALDALAYTQGTDIHVAPGQQQHVPHEAWHVVQQATGRVPGGSATGVPAINRDPGLEREADAMSALAMMMPAVRPPTAALAVPATAATASASAPIQLRGSNPYAAGGGISSHHVIPHSLLVNTLPMLNPAQQQVVLRSFLPDFDSLSVVRLLEAAITDLAGNPLQVAYNGAPRSKSNVANNQPVGVKAVGETPFGQLTPPQKATLTFGGPPGGVFATFAVFETRYGELVAGLGAAPDQKEQCMMEAFFEWQAGNQFYGGARYEPGTSNQFDADAQYVLGARHTTALKGIYDRLLALSNKTQPLGAPDQALLAQVYADLAALGTADRAIPADDDSVWTSLNTDEKEGILADFEGYRRVAASGAAGPRDNSKKIHKDLIRLARPRADKEADRVRDVLNALKGKTGATIDYVFVNQPAWRVKTGKGGGTVEIVGKKSQTAVTGKNIPAVASALDEAYKAAALDVFGL